MDSIVNGSNFAKLSNFIFSEIVSYEELVNNSYSRIIRKYDLKCSQSVLVRARKILKGEL